MPRKRNPVDLAIDKVLRALDALTPEQRHGAFSMVRTILERTGGLSADKPRARVGGLQKTRPAHKGPREQDPKPQPFVDAPKHDVELLDLPEDLPEDER